MRVLICAAIFLAFLAACSNGELVVRPAGTGTGSPTDASLAGTATIRNTASATPTSPAIAPSNTESSSVTAQPPGINPTGRSTPTPIRSGLDGSSGIDGSALAGPQCPVERPDSPCPDRPVANAEIQVYSGDRTQRI